MGDKRGELWDRFNILEICFKELKAVMQNQVPEEYCDMAIAQYKDFNAIFLKELAKLSRDVIEYLSNYRDADDE